MAEPHNTPYPPATPQSQTPRSSSPVQQTHPPVHLTDPATTLSTTSTTTTTTTAAAAAAAAAAKPKVLHIGDPIKYNPDTYAAFAAYFDVVRPSTPERQRPAFAAALRDGKWGDFSAVFRPFWGSGGEMGRWDAELVPLLPPSCRVFASAGAGFDWADTRLLGERGIIYCNSGLAAAEAVADFAAALIISTFRNLPWCISAASSSSASASASAFADCHDRATQTSHTLRGRTLGLVGYGNIGRQIAARMGTGTGFGMAVHYFDILHKDDDLLPVSSVSATSHPALESLLRSSDCVVLCAPGGKEEEPPMINATSLAWFKAGARLVNVARGSLVDEDALADALDEGRLVAAALDVHAQEPRPQARLVRLAAEGRCLLTCHNAGGTVETHAGFEELSMRNIMAVLGGGEPITPVNMQYLRR